MRRQGARFAFSALLALVAATKAIAGDPAVPKAGDPGVVPDDDLTLVVGTRFVKPTAAEASPLILFRDARIPVAAFNATDRCIDEQALEHATDYFNSLGRTLGKAGIFYVVPDGEMKDVAAACETKHGEKPKAWIAGETKLVAFGRVLPTADAPALAKAVE